jgi:5'(3')-deoxyribonucleotidase
MSRITKLYLDMDGVIADFDRNLREFGVTDNETHFIHKPRTEWTASQVALDLAVRGVMELEDFWPTIPVAPGSYELWDYCKQFDLHILTATPNVTEFRDRIARQKREWIQKHFGPFADENVHVCLRAEKAAFAAPTHLLVDDMPSNCKEWNAAGGLAIMHSTAQNTIQHLREIYHG